MLKQLTVDTRSIPISVTTILSLDFGNTIASTVGVYTVLRLSSILFILRMIQPRSPSFKLDVRLRWDDERKHLCKNSLASVQESKWINNRYRRNHDVLGLRQRWFWDVTHRQVFFRRLKTQSTIFNHTYFHLGPSPSPYPTQNLSYQSPVN